MRFKAIILALNLSALAAASHAQMLTPAKPVVGAPTTQPAAAPGIAAAPSAPAVQPSASNTAQQPEPLAPGVVSLSDVARQSATGPAPTTQVPAITIAEGTGAPIELARDKIRLSSNASRTAVTAPFSLSRITRVGGFDTAVIWIKGQNRRVTTGSPVLQYVVGEIKEDGVCLYPAKSKRKVKDKCKPFLTFQGM